jgi:O-antigen/teichoic acid export membrane protein
MVSAALRLVREALSSRYAGVALRLLVLNLAGRVLQFVSSIYAARCLGPTNLGISAQIATLAQQVSLVYNGGFDSVAVREIAADRERADALAGAVVLFRVVIALVGAAVWIAAALWLLEPSAVRRAWLAGAPLLVLSALNIAFLYQGLEQLPVQAAFSVLGSALVAGTYWLVFEPGMPVGADLAVAIVSTAITTAGLWVCWVWAGRAQRGRAAIDWRTTGRTLRVLLGKSWRYWVLAVLVFYYTAFQIPLIAHYLGDREVGVYRSALVLASGVELMFNAINNLLLPRLVVWHRHGLAHMWRQQNRAFWLFVLIGAPPIVLLIVASGPIYHRFLGPEFQGGVLVFQIMALGRLIVFVGQIYAYGLIAKHLDNEFLFASLAGTVASVALSVAFVPRHGIVAAAVIGVVAEIVVCASSYLFARAHVRSRAADPAGA